MPLLIAHALFGCSAESFRLHICDLATGKPHRLAVMPLFSYEALQRDGEWWYVIQIHGSLVAVLSQSLTAKPSELAIWNWKRGTLVKVRGIIIGALMRLLTDIMHRQIVCGMLQSHSFLTEEYLMLATSSRLGDAAQLKIEIVQINSNRNKVIYLGQDAVFCSFDLPTLQKSIDDTEILIRTDHTSQASFPERKIQPFTTSREDRIIVIACTSMTHDLESNVLFVPLSYFLALIKQVSEFVTEQCSPAFPWQEWGPQGTRMIYRSLSDIWFCYVHGMRVIVPVPDGERVQIYDFNQRSIRRDLIRYGYCPHTSTPWPRPDLKKLHNAGQPGLDTAGEARPSEFGYGDVSITEDDDEEKLGTTIICRASACRTDIFEQEPKTSLACRRHTFRSPIEPVASGYMLGEDSIIAVPVSVGSSLPPDVSKFYLGCSRMMESLFCFRSKVTLAFVSIKR